MGMFDSFYTEYEGRKRWVQTKAFANMLMDYRLGDEVDGHGRAIHRGVSAFIEEEPGRGLPARVILLLHDGIYVDFGWAENDDEAKRVAEELIERRVGAASSPQEVWKTTLARVVEERGEVIDTLDRVKRLLNDHAYFLSDPVTYDKIRNSPRGGFWSSPDFQQQGFFDLLREILGGPGEKASDDETDDDGRDGQ